jgi:hypothetical protein
LIALEIKVICPEVSCNLGTRNQRKKEATVNKNLETM